MSASSAAQVHVPPLALHPAEQRAGARRGARFGLGASLVAGTFALVLFALLKVPDDVVRFVLPFAWTAGLLAAGILAWTGSRSPLPADKLDSLSRGLVYAGVGLISPLTIHLAFVTVGHFSDFGEWVRMSLLYVGPTHVVFAGMLALRGVRGGTRPHLLAVWGASVGVTMLRMCPELHEYSIYAFLPALYVAGTAIPILVAVKITERFSRRTQAHAAQ